MPHPSKPCSVPASSPDQLTCANEQRWFILGAGALGCLWAAHLWQRSQGSEPSLPVTLLLRDEKELQRYQAHQGIALEDADSTSRLPVPATTLHQVGGPISHLLLATKTYDALSVLQAVRHLIDSQTRLVLLQNGLRLQRELSASWGADRVYCLSTTHGAWRREPFHVVHAGHGEGWLGTLAGGGGADVLGYMPTTALSLYGDPDINTRLWRKFAVNCAINALTVIYDRSNGEMMALPEARSELAALCAEITEICAQLPEAPDLPDLHKQVIEVLKMTANNFSSTLQDVRLGRRTELADLNGYLCELARDHGIDCPVNDDIIRRVNAIIR